jgi:hypothetical protein
MEINIGELISLIDKRYSNYEIAGYLDISRSSVVRLKAKLNLKSKFNEGKREQKLCDECGIEFDCLISENRKFCSHNCSASFNNRIFKRKQRKIKICLYCFLPLQGEDIRGKKFCDTNCHLKFKSQQFYESVELGEASSVRCKRYLIEKHGNKCMECGWDKINEFSGKVPIEIEHIDGNSENNSLDNLKLLCPNCHSLTKTYKALNKGKGRHKRMERYKEGKSF